MISFERIKTMSSRKRFPNRLRRYRRMMGYSQVGVARILGLKSKGRLSEWESGKHFPGVRNLLKLSLLYHTLIEQLYYDLREAIREDFESRNTKSTYESTVKDIPP